MSVPWCPFVTRREGPSWKIGYPNAGRAGPKRGDTKHSAEGWWWGIYSSLDGPLRKSWHFTVGLDRTEQHYPLRANCWHAGDVDDDGAVAANLDFVGIEHLGLAGQPLNAYQIAMTTRITEWCAEQEGRDRFRRFDGWDPDEPGLWLLAEHKEVSDVYTECPSDRIPWEIIIAALEEPMVSQADFDAFVAQQEAINEFQNEILVGQKKAIDLHSAILVDMAARLKALETRSHHRHA
jgi:hypothetical protein